MFKNKKCQAVLAYSFKLGTREAEGGASLSLLTFSVLISECLFLFLNELLHTMNHVSSS